MKTAEMELGQIVALRSQPETPLGTIRDITRGTILVDTFTDPGKIASKFIDAHELCNLQVKVTIPLEIRIEKDEPGFHVSCPKLRGFHTMGETIDEALRNANAAGEGFLKSVVKHYNEEHPIIKEEKCPILRK